MQSLFTVRNVSLLVLTIAVMWVVLVTASGYKVTVQVSELDDELLIRSYGNCGTGEKGCVKPKKNKPASITFKLRGKGFLHKNYECDDEGHNWELTKVELAGKNADNKPGGWPGSVDAQVQSDFSADPDGNVPFTVQSGHKIVIGDKNGTDKPKGSPGTEPYVIWYRLTATCNGQNPIYSDPRIRNTGNR